MREQLPLKGFDLLAKITTLTHVQVVIKQQKADPPCERGYECEDGGCGDCNGSRHNLSQHLRPFLPGLEVQRDLFT